MKIVVINGQNHKGSTWNIGNMLVNKIQGDNDVTEFFLPKDLNHFCCGCYACLEGREKCPFWSEKEKIHFAILQADLLIITSPNYCMMPSAQLKAFFDLFFTNWMVHKPLKEMFFKKAVVISTTAGAGAKKATGLIADNLNNWGVSDVTQYGIAVAAMNWAMVSDKKKTKINKDMDRIAKKISRQGRVHISIKTRFLFWMCGGMQKADWGSSKSKKQYWIDNGWLNGGKPWKK